MAKSETQNSISVSAKFPAFVGYADHYFSAPASLVVRNDGEKDETSRRREKQLAYNAAHGITPRTIIKKIKNTIEITKAAPAKVDIKDIPAELEKLKSLMNIAAKSLDFETAIKMRDRMAELKKIGQKYSGRRGSDLI